MAESSSPTASTSKPKRPREDGEAIKSRLLDQQFHIGRYADPLVPRKTSDLQFWPKDVTPEMEKKWLAIVKEHRW
ncbi:hypothetical protein HDV57DRAFT_289346 [Trichoderma longibrachiatum]|uniref:Uncharacterized protein n=1 Tax=Trichoderma longibrachiatum ATCC 18648 TaxID=983965 RepID=A0A2T4CD90_TRILO|nr:hypothetical protein M440DRAFT_1398793 [Trichoderma longibrachiatum ATCC 18648]